MGAHEPRLGHRQPHRALHAAGLKLSYAPGLAALQHDGLGRAQLGAATSSSLDGGDGVNSCDDAGVHYCEVTVTGPLSFTLKP